MPADQVRIDVFSGKPVYQKKSDRTLTAAQSAGKPYFYCLFQIKRPGSGSVNFPADAERLNRLGRSHNSFGLLPASLALITGKSLILLGSFCAFNFLIYRTCVQT